MGTGPGAGAPPDDSQGRHGKAAVSATTKKKKYSANDSSKRAIRRSKATPTAAQARQAHASTAPSEAVPIQAGHCYSTRHSASSAVDPAVDANLASQPLASVAQSGGAKRTKEVSQSSLHRSQRQRLSHDLLVVQNPNDDGGLVGGHAAAVAPNVKRPSHHSSLLVTVPAGSGMVGAAVGASAARPLVPAKKKQSQVGMPKTTGEEVAIEKDSRALIRWWKKGHEYNEHLFPGTVTAGDTGLASVRYDDGEECDNVPTTEIYTIPMLQQSDKDYLHEIGALSVMIRLGYLDPPCDHCSFCTSGPCSSCFGCRERQKCVRKNVCLFQTDEDNARKLQIPFLPSRWGVVPKELPNRELSFVLLTPRGKRAGLLQEAKCDNRYKLQLAGVDEHKFNQYLGLEGSVGLNVNKTQAAAPLAAANGHDGTQKRQALGGTVFGPFDHSKQQQNLMCGRFARFNWIDSGGRCWGVDGTISGSSSTQAGDSVYTITLNKTFVQFINSASGSHVFVPEQLLNVSHFDAMGACSLFRLHYEPPPLARCDKDACIWTVPQHLHNKTSNAFPSQMLVSVGWLGKLQVKQSIAHGENGGLGCYFTSDSISPKTQEQGAMVLPPGNFLDLGVCGTPEDAMPRQQFDCKMFIHSAAENKLAFSIGDGNNGEIVDLSDHLCLTMIKKAPQGNILSFIRETDGKEQPCVFMKKDPTGQIHCLLGHPTQEVAFKKGEPRELTLGGAAQLAESDMQTVKTESDFIEECEKATPDVISHNVAFLETLLQEQVTQDKMALKGARQRALLVAILSVKQLDTMERRSPRRGVSATATARDDFAAIKNRALTVLRQLSYLLDGAVKEEMFGLFRETLEKSLAVDTAKDFMACLNTMCA